MTDYNLILLKFQSDELIRLIY